jgi:hypothetical protein
VIAIARTELDAYGRSCREWNAEFSAAMGELARSKASKRPFIITLSLLCGEQTRHNSQRELPGNRTNTLSGAVRVTCTGRRLSENREGQTNLSLKLLRGLRRISYSTKLFTPITSAGTGESPRLGILALSYVES